MTEPELVLTFEDAVGWLSTHSTIMIRASRRPMANGVSAFPPQVATHYEAFWLRDYAYMLAGDIGAFDDHELEAACRLFVQAQREDGAFVDCVKFDGTPIYKPGYGTMGVHPVADGTQFTVDVAWRTCKRTGNLSLANEIMPALLRGMNAVPRSTQNGLVFIDPAREWDRCPYGFTDSVRKTGEVLFCSLLWVQACRQLSYLLVALGREDEAGQWQRESERAAAAVRTVFWDEELGLFHAATVLCKQPDIWGSAFAAFIGVATGEQTERIARYFHSHYSELVLDGQIRHLPGGVRWEKAVCPPETYQNGGYWGTPAGWFAWTLRQVDRGLAERTVINMVRDFQKNGVWEWINVIDGRRESRVAHYIASVTLPLEALRVWNSAL